ncbi:hypothetical protein CONCODRAFT_158028 [Conidiobolus coronatus NRRL 28638]|uniref:F-box domain-containing protein n=1 Tax=Conidiobolus coronatus (strain ATCC 28846 / CBS 209.66 / NRRL 28638) TaxID=796925 RepID=A0A137P6W0_CONC2|nr:hypothetical protein CONCODRAFT_158028 [Conidiobolus coronatus NRRL 28638]|eukprot:KXN70661.1 hypothetical protein CONCODRAFT_158028 [Conidiobolus coronatus NRRL 28638]
MNIVDSTLKYDGIPPEIEYIFKERLPLSDAENESENPDYSDYSSTDDNNYIKEVKKCNGNCSEVCVCDFTEYPEPKSESISLAKEVLTILLENNKKEVTRLVITETSYGFPYQYHFNAIIMSHFINLKYLFLELSHNPLDILNSCFEKFNYLETLIIAHSVIITYDEDANDVDLLIPKSLKNLKIISCKNYEAPISVKESTEDKEAYLYRGSPLNIIPKALPNLKKLVYDGVERAGEFICQFIQLNPQLEYVGSSKYNFTPHTLELISNIPNLKYEFTIEFDDPELNKVHY